MTKEGVFTLDMGARWKREFCLREQDPAHTKCELVCDYFVGGLGVLLWATHIGLYTIFAITNIVWCMAYTRGVGGGGGGIGGE